MENKFKNKTLLSKQQDNQNKYVKSIDFSMRMVEKYQASIRGERIPETKEETAKRVNNKYINLSKEQLTAKRNELQAQLRAHEAEKKKTYEQFANAYSWSLEDIRSGDRHMFSQEFADKHHGDLSQVRNEIEAINILLNPPPGTLVSQNSRRHATTEEIAEALYEYGKSYGKRGDKNVLILAAELGYVNAEHIPYDDSYSYDHEECLKKAAELGYIKAYIELAERARNPEDTLYWYFEAINRGSVEAIVSLAIRYEHGSLKSDDEPNNVIAAKLYLEAIAIENGDTNAFNGISRLATVYEKNAYETDGITLKPDAESDIVTATKIYLQAAELGNIQALGRSGYFFNKPEYNEYIAPYFEKYYKLLHFAEEMDYDEAMVALGNLYELGQYVEEDINKAKAWYEKAARFGNYFAKRGLKNFEQTERIQREEQQREEWRSKGLCEHCGNRFRGLFKKKCVNCKRLR